MNASRVVLGAALAAALGGCAVYPVEPVGVVYAAPPPPVVVQPSISFGYSSGYYGHPHHYRRHWQRRHWH